MWIYFLILRFAALFHSKARKLVRGQKATLTTLQDLNLQGCIWFHAASVGEFEQGRPLIERIRKEHPEQKILLTFFSPSGYEMRKDYALVDKVLYLPFATSKNAKRFLDAVQPRKAIFIKYEFWPAYLEELHKRQIDTYSIAAIFRPTQTFFKPWGGKYRALLKQFTHIFVQDSASQALLAKYHINNVTIAGDPRFDRVRAIAAAGKGIPLVEAFVAGAEQVIVAGSTWPKDEALLAKYLEHNPTAKLILVPHEIHEAHMQSIFQCFHGRFVRFSETQSKQQPWPQTLVIDTMGLLSSIYRYGTIAYIGGGFGVGIHNTLEAAVYGMPVVFGPNYKRFREACGLIEAGGGFSVKNQKELNNIFDLCLANVQTIGAKADAYVQSETGATEKLLQAIF